MALNRKQRHVKCFKALKNEITFKKKKEKKNHRKCVLTVNCNIMSSNKKLFRQPQENTT